MGVEKTQSVLPALGLGDISPFLNKLGDFKLGSSSTRIFRFGYMMWRMGHARGIDQQQMGKKVWDKEYSQSYQPIETDSVEMVKMNKIIEAATITTLGLRKAVSSNSWVTDLPSAQTVNFGKHEAAVRSEVNSSL